MRVSSLSTLALVALVALCSSFSAAQETPENKTISGSRDAKSKFFIFFIIAHLCYDLTIHLLILIILFLNFNSSFLPLFCGAV